MHPIRVCRLLLALTIAAAAVGCSGEDDPTTPPPPPIAPTSPANALAALGQKLEAGTSADIAGLLADDFTFVLSAEDAASTEPLVEDLARMEFLAATGNLKLSAPVVNVRGLTVPAVHAVKDVRLVVAGAWATEDSGPWAGAQAADVGVAMRLVREPEGSGLVASSVWRVFVRPVAAGAGEDGEQRYAIVAIVESSPEKRSASVTFGGICLEYMTDPGPTADLKLTYTSVSPFGRCAADASGSTDEGHQVPDLAYRWRLDTAAVWSQWSGSATHDFAFVTEGDHLIGVQVRDRWGQIDEAAATVSAVPHLPFPNTPALLMANFQKAYEEMDIDGFRQVIDPNFKIYLSQDTVNEYALPRDFFDYDEDVLITERMFSGNAITRPNGDIVPGITRIQFNIFEPEAAWETVPESSPRFPGASWAPFHVQIVIEQGNVARLNIAGRINFYLTPEEVEHQGRLQTRWRMVGQEDYTSVPAQKPTENASWGATKALYR